MKSAPRGKRTLAAEVTNISPQGFWVLIGEREHYAPFAEFPWFCDATVGELTNVQLPSAGHLYWPDLDVDLAVASLDHPEQFPLVSRVTTKKTPRPIRAKSMNSATSKDR